MRVVGVFYGPSYETPCLHSICNSDSLAIKEAEEVMSKRGGAFDEVDVEALSDWHRGPCPTIAAWTRNGGDEFHVFARSIPVKLSSFESITVPGLELQMNHDLNACVVVVGPFVRDMIRKLEPHEDRFAYSTLIEGGKHTPVDLDTAIERSFEHMPKELCSICGEVETIRRPFDREQESPAHVLCSTLVSR